MGLFDEQTGEAAIAPIKKLTPESSAALEFNFVKAKIAGVYW